MRTSGYFMRNSVPIFKNNNFKNFTTSASLMMSSNLSGITAPNHIPSVNVNTGVNTPNIEEVTKKLDKIKWELRKEDELNKPSESSTTSESFPWLIDKEGKFIDLKFSTSKVYKNLAAE